MNWDFTYGVKRITFGLPQVEHLKTKSEFKEFFDGKLDSKDIDKVWKELEKIRKPKREEKEEKEGAED